MKNVDLSNILISMGKSVDQATNDLRKQKLNSELEEVECEISLSVEIDPETLDKAPSQVKALKFAEIKRERFINLPNLGSGRPLDLGDRGEVPIEDSKASTLKIRALFSTKLSD